MSVQDSYNEVRVELDGRDGQQSDKKPKHGHSCCPSCPCLTSSVEQEDHPEEGGDETDGLIKWGNKNTKTVYVLSLLDGLQRVVIFTEDKNLAKIAQKVSLVRLGFIYGESGWSSGSAHASHLCAPMSESWSQMWAEIC